MNAFDWWLSALELAGDYGVLTREQCAELGVHEGEPECGYYRVPPGRYSDGAEVFVSILPVNGRLVATWDGVPVDPAEAWDWCCRYPISEERFERSTRAGVNRLGVFGQPLPAPGRTAGDVPQA